MKSRHELPLGAVDRTHDPGFDQGTFHALDEAFHMRRDQPTGSRSRTVIFVARFIEAHADSSDVSREPHDTAQSKHSRSSITRRE